MFSKSTSNRRDKKKVKCYNCGKLGHFKYQCMVDKNNVCLN